MRFPLLITPLLAAALLVGCSGDPATKKAETAAPVDTSLTSRAAYKRLRHRIDSLEAKVSEMVRQPAQKPDIRLTMYMIQAYQYFANDFPRDPLAAQSLDRAGQLYGGVLNDHEKAIEYYEKAYTNYPDYKARPQLLIQEGVAYEGLKDTTGASAAYRRLIVGYPQHPLSEQAKGLLKLLRMNPAEQQKMFEKK